MSRTLRARLKSFSIKLCIIATLLSFAYPVLSHIKPAQALIANGSAAIDVLGQYDGTSLTDPVGSYTKTAANDGANKFGLNSPVGVAFDTTNHRLFAVDNANNRVLVYNLNNDDTLADRVPDFVLGQPDFVSSAAATTASGLSGPRGVAIDMTNNRLFVADLSNNRVVAYNLSGITNGMSASYVLGQSLYTTLTAANSQSGLNGPSDLAYDATNSRLYVSEYTGNRVKIYDTTSLATNMNATYVIGQANWTGAAAANTQIGLNGPRGVAVDVSGQRIFIANQGSNRTTVYSSASLSTFSLAATNVLGQASYTGAAGATTQITESGPIGVAFDATNNRIFVNEYNNSRVTVYNGASLSTFSTAASNVLGQANYTSYTGVVSQSGSYGGAGIAYDPTNNKIYASQFLGNRISVFNTTSITNGQNASDVLGQYDGTSYTDPVPRYTKSGINNGPNKFGLYGAYSTDIDTVHHRAFLSDSSNNRVLVYNLNTDNSFTDRVPDYVIGQVDFDVATAAVTQSGLSAPRHLAYDSVNDRLYVTDFGNNRIMVYNTSTISNGMNAVTVIGQSSWTWGGNGLNQNGLQYATGMDIDTVHNRVFVAQSRRVTVYDVSTLSTFIYTATYVLGQPNFTTGTGTCQQNYMWTPQDVTYDSTNDRIFVSDYNCPRVMVFNVAAGTIANGMNASYVIGQSNFTATTKTNSQSSNFTPVGMAYDTVNNRLFVSDSTYNRVMVYNVAPGSMANGMNAINVLGQSSYTAVAAGNTSAGANGPVGVSYESNTGRLFVSNVNNHRVSIFDASYLAGFSQNKTTLSVNENGTGTFTVALTGRPTSNVVLNVSSSDTAKATVSASSLTFTPSNWNTAQTVTVTGTSDGNLTDESATITTSVNTGSSDSAWSAVSNQTVATTVVDTSVAGFTLNKSTMNVGEAGTNTYTAVLTAQPATDVVLNVSSGNTAAATISPSTLTFTNANWSTPQTVTVTGVNDNDVVTSTSTITTSVNVGSSNASWASVTSQDISASVIDDDTAGFTLSKSSLTVPEAGTDTYTVVLSAQPTSDVVLDVGSANTAAATVSPSSITFTTANWSTPRTITVSGVNDANTDNESVAITVSVNVGGSDSSWSGVSSQPITATLVDDDIASSGFTLSKSSMSVTENAGTNTFTVVLDNAPSSDVVIDLTSSATGDATVSPSSLTFTTANWNTPRTVTVTGVNDNIVDGGASVTITASVHDATSDDAFDALADKTVAITIANDDTPNFTQSALSASSMSENGGTVTYTVVLDYQPTSDVVINLGSSATGVATVSPSSLTFTTANWNTPRTVTVTGVNNNTIGAGSVTITASVDASSSGLWTGVSSQTKSPTVNDDDTASFNVSKTTATVAENGGTDTFTVVLTAQPASNVVIDLSSSVTGDVTVSPSSVTFTNANWSTPQTVTVTGVNDNIVDGGGASTITASVHDATSDDNWDPAADKTVAVTATDDDTASKTVSVLSPTSISENGATSTFTVVLDKQPASDVIFNISSNATSKATVSPSSLTFTSANWATPRTVTITAVNNSSIGADSATITVAVDGSSNALWTGLSDTTRVITLTDDDSPGYSLSENAFFLGENGGTNTFTAVLTAQPTTNVVIDLTSADTDYVTVSPSSLTFTNVNWSTPQTVTVTGVDNNIVGPNGINNGVLPIGGGFRTAVTASIHDATSDNNFDSLADQSVAVGSVDDDIPSFTVSPLDSSSIGENGGETTFTVVLDKGTRTTDDSSGIVFFDVTSSSTGTATVDTSRLTFDSSNWDQPQTVTVSAVNNGTLGDGSATISVTPDEAASDGYWSGYMSVQTRDLTVADDDVAGFTLSKSSMSVAENAGTNTFTVVLNIQPATDVVIDLSSSATGDVTVSPSSLTFTHSNWATPQTVTATGVNDNIVDGGGASTITASVHDSTSDNAFDPLSDQTVAVTATNDDTASYTASAVSSSSIAENGGTATFTVVLDKQPVSDVIFNLSSSSVSVATVSPSSLTFTNSNWSTPQTVTITGVNNGTIGDGSATITASVDGTSSALWTGVADKTRSVTTTDDDIAGFTLSKTSATVGENGGTDTFTVVLNVQPASDVVIDLASSATGEATVSSSSLTFTSANWSTPQTVTVTGVNDSYVNGGDSATITASVHDATSDDNFDAVADQTVSVSVTNDDTASFTLGSLSNASISEGAGTSTFTVVLDKRPVTNVVFNVTSSATSKATVSPATLTFTTANWSSPQTVTITGVNNNTLGNDSATATVSVDGTSNSFWTGVADQTRNVTLTDNDTAGFTLSKTTASVSENAGTDTFTIALTAQPSSNVVIDLSSSATGDVTVSPSSLTFTTVNWSTPQTVTVTGVNDNIVDSGGSSTITASIHDATSDDNFDAVADQTVAVTATNDDTAATTIGTLSSASISENGATSTFTFVLDKQPTSNVIFNVSSSATGDATVSPATLTFTTANWSTPQTVTITSVNDNTIGNASAIITVAVDPSSSALWTGLADKTRSITITDDDTADFNVSKTTATVSENGGTDTFTVVLTAQPASNVRLNTGSSAAGDVTVSPSSLTFTTANWSTPQTVTVTGVNDNIVDGGGSATITIGVNAGLSDGNWSTAPSKTVAVTATNDDSASYTLGTLSNAAISEGAGTSTFTVVLDKQPTSNVVFNVTSSATGKATVSPATLTFTSANWSTPQTVTITGVNNNTLGNDSATATVAVDASSNSLWTSVADQTRNVTLTDNDTAGFNLSKTTATVAENGGTDTFTAVLTAQPASDVVIDLSSGSTGDATVSPSSLTFTTANWSTPQTVTVTGVNDNIVNGGDSATITASVHDATTDDNFDAVADKTVAVTATNDDTASYTASAVSSSAIAENGGTSTFTVVLDKQPTSNVVFNLSSSSASVATVSPATLTFTTANWSTPQTVTITGVNNAAIGDGSATITVSVDPSSSALWTGVADKTRSVTITDDDTAGFTLSKSSVTAGENGGTDTFTAVLNVQPTSNVVIDLSSSATGEATVSPSSLTFTTANWSTPQTVTVTGVNDNIVNGGDSATITASVHDSTSDNNFDPLADQTVSTSITNDDTASFTLGSLSASSISEGAGTSTFTVVLDKQPTSSVIMNVTSSATSKATVSPSSLTFTTANWSTPRTVTITGVNNNTLGNDSATITVSVDPSSSALWTSMTDQTRGVTVTDNDTAGFNISKTTATVAENGGTDTFTVVLTAQPNSDVVIDLSSSATGEATVSPATVTFTSANWSTPQSVTITGVNDNIVNGGDSATITASVHDATSDDNFDAVADKTVTTTVTNDDSAATTIGTLSSSSISENGATSTFTFVLDKQPVSDVIFNVSSSATADATVSPSTLTFTSSNWSTPQTVTITSVNDNTIGNTSATITVAVDPSSSALWTGLSNKTRSITLTDDDTAGFNLSKTTASVSENGGTDTFTVVLTAQPNTDVVLSVGSGTTADATVSPSSLTFTTSNWNTPRTVTVTGVNDSIVDAGGSSTITVAVTAASSDDNFDAVASKTVAVTATNDDTASFTLGTLSAASISEGAGTSTFTVVLDKQPVSDVIFNVTSSSTSSATVSPATVTFTSVNWATPRTVTITGVNNNTLGNGSATITVAVDPSSSALWTSMTDQTRGVTVTDNDTAGFNISKTTAAVAENGGTDSFTVVLTAQPASDVVIDLSSSSTADVTVSPSSLTFTSANWSTPQTVTITGVNDNLVNGGDSSTITASVHDATSDDNFDAVADKTVATTVTNDDSAATTIGTLSSASISENGATSTFTFVLDKQPTSNVVFNVSSSATGKATVSPATLTFTNVNWSTPQTITITSVNNNTLGNDSAIVTVAVDPSSSALWTGLADKTRSITLTDDDTAGFNISKSASTVAENGGTDTFTVVLTAQPSSNVVIALSSSSTAEATVSPSSLTFTTSNWNTPRTVTITGVNDNIVNSGDSSTITASIVAASSDDNFDAVADKTVAATVTNDDSAGFTLGALTDPSIAENGGTTTFTVVLNKQPTSNVVLNVTSSATSKATVSPATLTFTTANWSTPRTVTVTGVNNITIGDDSADITVAVDASSSALWTAVADQVKTVPIDDDDSAGFTLSKTSATVGENGGTDTFTVVLNTQPSSDVVVNLSSSATGDATVSPSSLTFTSVNWNTPRTVTITGVNDNIVNAGDSATITIAINTGASDPDYASVASRTVATTVTNDDTPSITLGALSNGSISENGETTTFTVVLNKQPTSNVVLNVTSSATSKATVSPATLTFTTANWSTPRTVTITSVNNDTIGNDAATATVSVDASSSALWTSLTDQSRGITLTDDDTAGFTSSKTTSTIAENGGTDTYTIVLTAQPSSNVRIDLSSSAAGIATVSPSTLTFTSSNWSTPRTVTITGVNNDTVNSGGNATITAAINTAATDDNFDSVPNQTVAVTVTNDDTAHYTVSSLSSSTIAENAGTSTFTVVLDKQPVSDVIFTIDSSATSKATVSPATLTFTNSNWSTPQTVTITAVNNSDTGDDSADITIAVDGSSDALWTSLGDTTRTVDISDDDAAGFELSTTTATVGENGGTSTFTVVLSAQPTTDVVLTANSSSTSVAQVTPPFLTFTNSNWSTPQTVTITGVNDNFVRNDTALAVISVVNSLSDDSFDSLADQSVTITKTDDDTAGVRINVVNANTTEDGGSAIVQFRLLSQPVGDAPVTIPLSLSNAQEGTLDNITSITIAAVDWDNFSANEIHVYGVDDSILDGNIDYQLITGDVVCSDPAYASISGSEIDDATLTNTDNEVAGPTQTSADTDGVSDAIENAGPNNGDANADGTLDSEQNNVTSISNPVSGGYTMVVSATCTVSNVHITRATAMPAQDASYSYPFGLLSYTLNCANAGDSDIATVANFGPATEGLVIRKFNSQTNIYSPLSNGTLASADYAGNHADVVIYHLTDGGINDEDGNANGSIVDPVGFAVAITSASTGHSSVHSSTIVAGEDLTKTLAQGRDLVRESVNIVAEILTVFALLIMGLVFSGAWRKRHQLVRK